MKLKTISLAMLVFLSLVLGRAGSAQEIQPLEPDWLRQMYEEGWQKVQEGVLRRDLGEGKFETFGYGAEGFQWLIETYSRQLAYFEGEYRESSSAELASLIDQLQDKITALQNDVLAAPAAESFDGGQIEGCSLSYDYTADAGPLSSTQGVTATASAYFHNTCPETGSTFAYAYAHAAGVDVIDTVIQEDPENNGTWIDSYATASIAGSTECESRAQASVDVPSLGLFRLAEDTNYDCPDMVSITGPSQVLTDYYGPACADVTWTASTASGRTDYTFEWYIGTDLVGTDPTFTKQYCAQNVNVTVRVVARDDAGWSDDATFDTEIKDLDRIMVSVSGPSTVNTDYYGSPCATVTWTASASGGHSGYNYSWYLGTDPTVQGTGNTFSKQYCNTSQSVTVKVVATASDGHSDSSSKTTNIVYKPQLTASVSGPASVITDYYGPTCVNVTWTASATGGHPGYTYSWYLGTSTGTTVQGTGLTFTKSLCNTNQSVTVKAVDSDGHTANKTFTTNVQYRAAIVAKITGPTSVSSSTSCTTVSWTASASGSGHSGFSYKWYIGTTLQTTGTTFSKQFCSTGGTSQSVTVKATATASDGHQDTDTHTTTISFGPPPLTASISGQDYVEIFGTLCADLTWTANVSGGTPAYTYSWTIGTSTTVLSTTSTLTKRVCNSQTLNVKLAVRDSASQTANATFTTIVYDEGSCLDSLCQ